MSLNDEYNYLFKVLLIGDSGVGKSSLLLRYVDDIYTDSYISTIGVDFKIKTVDVEGKGVKLQIWDTAGQERFRTITSSYYRGAHAIAVAFDLTDVESFRNVTTWLDEVQRNTVREPVIILVGTKSDKVGKAPETDVNHSEIINFAEEHNMLFVPTSAKKSQGVEHMFTSICKKLLESHASICGGLVISPKKLVVVKKNGCC